MYTYVYIFLHKYREKSGKTPEIVVSVFYLLASLNNSLGLEHSAKKEGLGKFNSYSINPAADRRMLVEAH